jgi:hypothetical protein
MEKNLKDTSVSIHLPPEGGSLLETKEINKNELV